MSHAADSFGADAAEYARRRPHYPPELFAFIARHAPGRNLAWDAATGNGQAAHGLVRYFTRVYASDGHAAQIAAAPPHPRVTYHHEAAEACSLPAASCDAVTVAQALHWFDLPRFSAVLQRVLRPGGLFCAWGYSFATVTPAVDALIERELLTVLEPYWAAQNQLLWRGYRDIELPLRELPVPSFELDLHWDRAGYLSYLATWSASRRAVAERGDAWWADLCGRLATVWPDSAELRSVRMPLLLRAAVNA
jgi:SAM-dependent methyltransferase